MDCPPNPSAADQTQQTSRRALIRGEYAWLYQGESLSGSACPDCKKHRSDTLDTDILRLQPTTIDCYMNTHCWGVSRNPSKLFRAYDRINVCSLSGAASSGTSWPINSTKTPHTLGLIGRFTTLGTLGSHQLTWTRNSWRSGCEYVKN